MCFMIIGCLVSGGCFPSAEREYHDQQIVMDTLINIKVYGPDEALLKKAVAEAFGEIERIAELSDRFAQPGTPAFTASDVCRINQAAGKQPVKVSDDVFKMIELSVEYNRLSGGAFDITVAPLLDLWGWGKDVPHRVPGDAEITQTLALVDSRKILLDKTAQTVYLAEPRMSLDLGAVAKGYATQKAAEILKKSGVNKALINAGGNIVTIGRKDDKNNWQIGIEDPRDTQNIVGVLSLADEVAVTSGDYQRGFVADGVYYHHILSPQTGRPAGETWSVTVVGKDSALADVLSTALFVLGPQRGLALVENLAGVDAFFVGADQKIYVSSGLKDKVQITPGGKYTHD